jgi:hypothetical protein
MIIIAIKLVKKFIINLLINYKMVMLVKSIITLMEINKLIIVIARVETYFTQAIVV